MLNILDITFLSLTIFIVFLGSLIINYEKHLPVSLVKFYGYGSFGYKGSGGEFLQAIEIPKYYYRHFYVFSTVISSLTLVYMVKVYFLSCPVNKYVHGTLKFILEEKEPAVSVTAALIAMGLIAFHCARRCLESHLLQVFARSGKMNLCHYANAYAHYATLILATVGQAPLFCGDQNIEKILWIDTRTKLLFIPSILMFLLATYEQYRSNVILADLRKDKKTKAVITEEYRIPHGRMFVRVSSPHRLCEIIIYTAFVMLIPTKTMFIMWVWVLSNQTQCALHAQRWYKKTFKNYPENRMALFPFLL